MQKTIKKHLAIITVMTLLFISVGGQQGFAASENSYDQASPEKMIVDAVIARPLGIAATVVGTAFFIVSFPFSVLGGNTAEAAKKMVGEPAYFTFRRPLGDF